MALLRHNLLIFSFWQRTLETSHGLAFARPAATHWGHRDCAVSCQRWAFGRNHHRWAEPPCFGEGILDSIPEGREHCTPWREYTLIPRCPGPPTWNCETHRSEGGRSTGRSLRRPSAKREQGKNGCVFFIFVNKLT